MANIHRFFNSFIFLYSLLLTVVCGTIFFCTIHINVLWRRVSDPDTCTANSRPSSNSICSEFCTTGVCPEKNAIQELLFGYISWYYCVRICRIIDGLFGLWNMVYRRPTAYIKHIKYLNAICNHKKTACFSILYREA